LPRIAFYKDIVARIIEDIDSSVLICGGASLDYDVFRSLEFRNVTITNYDTRESGDSYVPYSWAKEDATALSYEDNSFDYVITHDSIHHTSQPHKAITEMYRVCSKGMLFFESPDNMVTRIGTRLGLVQEYETSAVYYNDEAFGGVDNSEVPNYIYRWTEQEIRKTIASYAPYAAPAISFFYRMALPSPHSRPDLQLTARGKMKYRIIVTLKPLLWAIKMLFPRQQNLFACHVNKTLSSGRIFPWISEDESTGEMGFNKKWGKSTYSS
jgi:SAM-dependent methyltransferase